MFLIRGMHNLKAEHRNCVATIGNFDGVHLGHQAVISQLAEKAAELKLPACVVTFEPQAAEFFKPESSPARLTRFREKFIALQHFAVDRILCLPFNAALSALSAEEFIQKVLLEGLGVKYLVVGDDFRFGKGRRGDFELLTKAGQEYGFQVVHMHTFDVDESRVSSTRIRQALAQGELSLAKKLLGRGYRMSGRVAYGAQRGRTIGFPTANIFLHRQQVPLSGVFAVKMFGLESSPLQGVANIGTRPTVDGSQTLLEVHLFDFDQDIYGKHVQIEFIKKLRDEEKFDSFDELKQQILTDAQQARQCLQ
ncbi:FMN adenylyltransferase / Riboflavin kinase [hydrothermal vent metagenome]|uniref:Bifunctional riboflavin kinase/FMN adenylyltransferase n=1 Tax=hydrothermal vent metagenome TaxID=652676 RepID=A0A3B0YI34_9ZZZZ